MAQIAKFRPNLGQFWPKRAILNFPKKCEYVIYFRLQKLGLVQNRVHDNEQTWIKMQKNLHFGLKRPNLNSIGQNGQNEIFWTKCLEHFFCVSVFKLTTKFQKKKWMDSEKTRLTNEWTNGETNEQTRAKFKVLTNS